MNTTSKEIEIDLREILNLIRKNIWILLGALILSGLVTALFSKYALESKYSSTSKIYILTNSDSMVSLSDLQMGSSLASDYAELIKSRPVVEEVASNLKLDMSYSEMLSILNVENPSNTRILSITVRYKDPIIAKEVADEFASVSKQQISKIMRVEEPSIVEKAIAATAPSSPNHKRNIMIGALAGLVLAFGVCLVLYVMDDTLKTAEDVEKYLGVNTLASIPRDGGTDNLEKKSNKKLKKD